MVAFLSQQRVWQLASKRSSIKNIVARDDILVLKTHRVALAVCAA